MQQHFNYPYMTAVILVAVFSMLACSPYAADRLAWIGINYGLGEFGLGGGFLFQFYPPEFATFGGIEYP